MATNTLPEGKAAHQDSPHAHAGARFRMPVWCWLVLWAAFLVGLPVLAHYQRHDVLNAWHLALCVFLAINLLICVWEISLWHRIADIRRWFHDPKGSTDRPRGQPLCRFGFTR